MPGQELDAPLRHWRCPSCPTGSTTQKAEPHTEFHQCVGNGGLNLPLVEVQSPDADPDARHIPQLGEKGVLTSIGTEHGSGRIDRTVIL